MRRLLVLGALICGSAASAATFEVEVRERGGSALPGRKVCARLERNWGWSRADLTCAETDAAGKASIANVPPGSFSLYVDSPQDADLVPTLQNPWEGGARATIREETERIPAVIELERGIPVWIEVRNGYGEFPKPLFVRFRDVDSGVTSRIGLGETGKRRVVAPARRYEVALDHPPSHAAVALEVDGARADGLTAGLDLAAPRHTRYLTWDLTTGGWIRSRVEFVDSPDCAGRPVARPAPGSEATGLDPVPLKQPDRPCVYESWLPPGAWRVAVEGDRVVASDPPFVDVTVETGSTARADFRVETADDGRGAVVHVEVFSPDGESLLDARVVARPMDGDAVVSEAEAPRFPPRPHVLRGLRAETVYRIEASHPELLPESASATAVVPGDAKPESVVIHLRSGASVLATALGPDDAPRPGVRVEVGERAGTTDASGRTRIGGLESGTYPLRVSPPAGAAEDVTEEIAEEVEVVEGQTKALKIRLRPAVRFTGSLRCIGEWPPPPRAAMHVHGDEEVVLSSDREDFERFSLGPLRPGAYRLAIEPEGVAYRSWASGALREDDGVRIQVDEPGVVDLGAVEVECGPLMSFATRGIDLPGLDWTAGRLEIEVRNAAGESVPVRVEPHGTGFVVRRAPDGEVEIRARATHPFLIPGEVSTGPVRRALERGRIASFELPFEGLGGALEVRADGIAVRVTAEDGTTRVAPVEEGVAFFGGLAPGPWRVERCEDRGCARAEPSGMASVAPLRRIAYPKP